MKFFRWLRAFLGGYYWLPCCLCGRMYGGFESADDGLMDSWYSGRSVCKNCGERARELNKKWMEENPELIDAETKMPIEKDDPRYKEYLSNRASK